MIKSIWKTWFCPVTQGDQRDEMTRLQKTGLGAVILLTWLATCDPPPKEAFLIDAGASDLSDGTADNDTEAREDGTGADPVAFEGMSCIQGVMCMLEQPLNADGCLEGMAPETREAAMAVAACAFQNCASNMGNESELLTCLLTSCTAEALGCVTGGLGEMGF